CYVAHLWNEKKNLDAVLAETEQLLRNTYGYEFLRASANGKAKADKLLEATRNYAQRLAAHPGHIELADMTGFSPEGVGRALTGLRQLERELTPADWTPESLFGKSSGITDLFGIMLRIPQLAATLSDLGGTGARHQHIAEITQAWVSGKSV